MGKPCPEGRQEPCQQQPSAQALGYLHLPEVLHTRVAAAAAGPGQRALSELSTVHAVHGVTLLGAPSADPRGSFGGRKSSLSWTLLPWHCFAAVA